MSRVKIETPNLDNFYCFIILKIRYDSIEVIFWTGPQTQIFGKKRNFLMHQKSFSFGHIIISGSSVIYLIYLNVKWGRGLYLHTV